MYHRFSTLSDLLAAMWIRAVQRSQEQFLAALDDPDAMEAAVAAALAFHDFATAHPADARRLASLRRQDLIGSVHDSSLRSSLEQLNAPLEDAMLQLARRRRAPSDHASA